MLLSQRHDSRWWGGVPFGTTNNKNPDKRCPYKIDIQAVGFFSVAEQLEFDQLLIF